jgi:two-component system NarL family response regulator
MFGVVDTNEPVPRVIVADSQHFFRAGLRGVLEEAGVAVVGEASSGAEIIALGRELAPDVIVIDLNMTDASDATALRDIAAASSDAQIMVLSSSAEAANVIQALSAGAAGYVLKGTPPDELVSAIRQLACGHVLVSREAIDALVACASMKGDSLADGQITERPELTSREMDVLRLIVEGADNATIGLQLSISRHTVKQHVTNIFEKLDVRTRAEAAVYAVRSGLI